MSHKRPPVPDTQADVSATLCKGSQLYCGQTNPTMKHIVDLVPKMLFGLLGISFILMVYSFAQPAASAEQEIMVVRYAEVLGGGRKSLTVVKADGSLEVIDLNQGRSEENMGLRLAELQQVLAEYQKEGWQLRTSVSNATGGVAWFQDHFLVR